MAWEDASSAWGVGMSPLTTGGESVQLAFWGSCNPLTGQVLLLLAGNPTSLDYGDS